jgi:hypothetical protein
MTWGTYQRNGEVEVKPVDEEHVSEGECPCDPRVEVLASKVCGHPGCGAIVVVHNSFREASA